MSSKFGSWLIVGGVLFAFFGLCALPAALGANGDKATLSIAATFFSFGILLIAGGIYAKALALQSTSTAIQPASTSNSRRVRGGCELCGTEQPVVHCTVHQLHLCGSCLARHYDHRSCSYVPHGWSAPVPARTMVARRNG